MRYIFCIVFVVLFGCSDQPIILYQIDDDFAVHVNSFHTEAKKRGIEILRENLIIKFGEPNAGFLATSYNGEQRLIVFSKSKWELNPLWAKEYFVFHELGHSLLKRGHIDGFSIMNENAESLANFLDSRDKLIDELFSLPK